MKKLKRDELVELGDLVEDEVTGFEGVATASHEYLFGCRRFTIQPMGTKDGDMKKSYRFDEPRLRVVTKQHYQKPEVQIIQDEL